MPEFFNRKVTMTQVAAWVLAALMTGAAGAPIANPNLSTAISQNAGDIKEMKELIRQLELSNARVAEQLAGLRAGQERIEKRLK